MAARWLAVGCCVVVGLPHLAAGQDGVSLLQQATSKHREVGTTLLGTDPSHSTEEMGSEYKDTLAERWEASAGPEGPGPQELRRDTRHAPAETREMAQVKALSRELFFGVAPPNASGAASPPRDEVEREQALFRKHWWPLNPPPFHHPGRVATEKEYEKLRTVPALYSLIWRSLPQFQPSPLLQDAERAPYLKLANWTTAAKQGHPLLAPRRQLQILCHHKTGVNLLDNIQAVLRTVNPYYSIAHTCEGLFVSGAIRTLHMVRDPVDMILSGYRYHQFEFGGELTDWGHGKLTQDPQCFECDDDDHRAMFDSCQFNCTYFELVNRLNETAGVVTEALSARKSVTSMASFMSLWKYRSETLHLSFNLFKAGFNQTCACLLKFLGLPNDPAVQDLMVKAVRWVSDPYHVTSGHFNNTALKAYLRNHPVWGPDFRQVKELMKQVFLFQARRWGCPEAEAEEEEGGPKAEAAGEEDGPEAEAEAGREEDGPNES